jgi:hypothetical protein
MIHWFVHAGITLLSKRCQRYWRWLNEELALASSTMKEYNAVKGFKALCVQGNITFFMNPLVHNDGYDRPRYAQAYVMDGDISTVTMANLQRAREVLGVRRAARNVFRTTPTWQDFIDDCEEAIARLRAMLGRVNPFAGRFM